MSTQSTTTETPAVTAAEVDAINAARDALKAIASRNHGRTTQGTASVASDLLFTVLNHASTYGGASLTDEQLYGAGYVRPGE